MNYLYLHGFASAPQSTKALYLRDRFAAINLSLIIPDLNQADFYSLTLTRQIQQCEEILSDLAGDWCVIGSSLGGLTAAWLAQRNSSIQQLVLLAPAFGFLNYWKHQLGSSQLSQWQQTGSIEVYHHGEARSLPLGYSFWEDASQYDESDLTQLTPTLILHGIADDIVPVQSSRHYIQSRPWCTLIELNSDHALIDVMNEIWGKNAAIFTIASHRVMCTAIAAVLK